MNKVFPFHVGITASHAAYMVAEGWDVWATTAQWRRMQHKANAMGLNLNVSIVEEDSAFDGVWEMKRLCSIMFEAFREKQMQREFEAAAQARYEIDVFMGEMNMMGMLEADFDTPLVPMWANTCLN